MNEQQQVKLSDLTIEQLKAHAYDQVCAANRAQQVLAALEQEIQRRASEPVAPPPEQAEPAKE
jgi:hypothetical protein